VRAKLLVSFLLLSHRKRAHRESSPAALCQDDVVTKETKETKETKAKSNKLHLVAVRKEEVQMAIERDYARRGLAYLSEDELNKQNFAYGPGPVKRVVSALL